ncbi:MAG: hypothetical protein LBO69_05130 [Ignavibacteria bacterium]|nr:hypothetical protein [Ignavibacteria bacterium]
MEEQLICLKNYHNQQYNTLKLRLTNEFPRKSNKEINLKLNALKEKQEREFHDFYHHYTSTHF